MGNTHKIKESLHLGIAHSRIYIYFCAIKKEKMDKTRNIIKLVSALSLILVFLIFSFENLAYKHQHLLADGTLIEHSHPFSKDKGGNHQHSNDEIIFLAMFSAIAEVDIDFPNIQIKTQKHFTDTPIVKVDVIQLLILPRNFLRGPPQL